MIIGNSYDADGVDVFQNIASGETVKVMKYFSDEVSYYHENEDYRFLGSEDIPYIEDNPTNIFSTAISETDIFYIECDYCKEHYQEKATSSRSKRKNFKWHFNNRAYGNLSHEIMNDIHKDHCPKCEKDKRRETTMLSTGYFHPTENPEHREYMSGIFKEYNMVPTSRGQRYLSKLLNGELNVHIDYFFADIVVDRKIIIEYDGGGHNLRVMTGSITQEEFDKREKERSAHLISKGYKILRFISPEELFPADENYTLEIITEAIENMINNDIDEYHIHMGNRRNNELHGKLRPIKDILTENEWGEGLL